MLTLVENGKANVEIVVMTHAPLVRFAAEELQQFIGRATGVEVAIVSRRSGTIPAIALGDSLWLRQAAGIDVGRMPRDGFRIKRIADVIYIAGRADPYADPKKILGGGAPIPSSPRPCRTLRTVRTADLVSTSRGGTGRYWGTRRASWRWRRSRRPSPSCSPPSCSSTSRATRSQKTSGPSPRRYGGPCPR